jgi:DNA-3-methyladenine glycosylase
VTRDELTGPPEEVAVRLLGASIVAGDVVVRLVEVEAYGGTDDPASHAYRGPTPRNKAMFGPPGFLYVYLSYGMHHCANVVCGDAELGSAVLLRGAEVLSGEALVRERRGRPLVRGLLDGPGKLCQGLAIDLACNGIDVLDPRGPIRLAKGKIEPGEQVVAGPRIGISKETERPWRFRLVGPVRVEAPGNQRPR